MFKSLALGLALVLAASAVLAETQVKATLKEPTANESSTESPIADMALIEDAPVVPKMPTEKPPVAAAAVPAMPVVSVGESATSDQLGEKSAQPHTVADFIIHPLIAFKPRQAALDELQAQGKQATPAGTTSTSPSTWLFGMNPGQGIGSSFSTLAGSVSGWFNDRLTAAGQQLPSLPGLPGLVDTPVRDSASTSTTSTTTQRPDIVVRVQQRPNRRRGNGNGNGNANLNGNGNGNRNGNRVQRPNRFNNRLDSLESEEYDDIDYFNGNRFEDEFEDEELDELDDILPNDDEQSLEQVEDEDDEQLEEQQQQKQKQRRRPVKSQTIRRKTQSQTQAQSQRRQLTQKARRGHPVQQPLAVLEQADEEQEDDEAEVEQEDDDAEESDETFAPVLYKQSSRKSQSQPSFIQSSQQNLINQLRRLTFGQTPTEVGNKLRKSPNGQVPNRSGVRRPQQTTLVVNRDGQAVYLAPEYLNLSPNYPYGYVSAPSKKQQRLPANVYPQGPITVPLRRKGRPTQYITIPWSQLGLTAPELQQPVILNIPEGAISALPVRPSSGTSQKKKKRPSMGTATLPLLADASLMDIFQPPQIPPSRTGNGSNKPKPLLIAAKPVSTSGLLPTRIRPGTIVEKAPAMESADKSKPAQAQSEQQEMETSESAGSAPAAAASSGDMAADAGTQPIPEQEFIIVGDDNEPGVSRHVQPVYGDARYVSYGDYHPYFDLVHQNRHFALRKVGRALQAAADAAEDTDSPIVKV